VDRYLKAVLFDLDGTLIHSVEHIVKCWQYATLTCLGREMTREEILPTIGRTLADAFEEVAPGRNAELHAAYKARQIGTHDIEVELVPGTVETLRASDRYPDLAAKASSEITNGFEGRRSGASQLRSGNVLVGWISAVSTARLRPSLTPLNNPSDGEPTMRDG